MKRILYWVGAPLIITVTFAASLRWPEFVIWVAWMLAALLWFSASVVGGEAEEAKRSRDRWASLARKAEAEVDRLQRQLEKRQAEVENLRGAIDKFAELVDTRNAEIGRLKGEFDQLRPYADPRLFAAASDLLTSWFNDFGGDVEVFDEAIGRLREAVAWWDGLAGAEGVELTEEVSG